MAHIVADLVCETTTTTGTGALTLAGAVAGHQTFAAVCANGDTVDYCARAVDANGIPTGDWEIGLGTWGTGGILTRTSVIQSSNADAAVSFAAGTKRVSIVKHAGLYETLAALTEDTVPDGEADFLLSWNSAAGATRKVKPRNLFKNSTFHLGADLSPTALSANQNNYSPTSLATAAVLRLDASNAVKITGLAGGEEGRVLVVANVSTAVDGDIILTAEDAASTAANRFAVDNDTVLEPGSAAVLWYDSVSSRWRIVAVRRKYTGSTFRTTPFYCSDFLGAAGADTGEASYAVWDYAVISSGTQAKVASLATHPGILRTSSSTTTNSGGYCRTAADAILLAGGEFTEFVFRLPDLTTLTARLGFIDTATSTDCTDGAYIEVSSTGAAVGKTSNNSTRTTSATIATLSANTWYRARIVVNRDASAVDFYIFSEAGDLLGSQQNTANIPTAAGRETGHGYIATKSGTTAQSCIDMDFMSLEFTKALI